MLNYNYIKEILNTILNLTQIENKNLYYSLNKSVRNDDIILYSIYVNPFIYSKELNSTIENIFVLTHSVNGTEYEYNNITEEEIITLSKILELLNINFTKISVPELELKKKVVEKTINDTLDKVSELKAETEILEKKGLMIEGHKKNLEIIVLEKALRSIYVTYNNSNRRVVIGK